SRSSRTVSRSPGVNPMNVESAGSCRIDAGTVTVAFIPIRSTATTAGKIFVRLAGAQAACAFDCQRNRPVSRLMRATSWASIAGSGIGRTLGGAGATVGMDAGVGDRGDEGATGWRRTGRGSGLSYGSPAVRDTGIAVAASGWCGDAEPSVLPSAPAARTNAVKRSTWRSIAGEAAYRIRRRKTRAIALQCGSRRDDEIGRRWRLKIACP